MTDINNVTLVGRITRDLDEKSYNVTASGFARARISLAVNRSAKKDNQWVDEASFIDITILGKTAENLRPYLTKGTQVAVEGYLKQDRWQDKQTGQNRSAVSVVANNIQLLGGKRDGQGGSQQSGQQQGGFTPTQQYQQPQGFDPAAGFPEDVPF